MWSLRRHPAAPRDTLPGVVFGPMAIPMAIMAASAMVSAAGAMQQGAQAEAMGEYNARVSAQNAQAVQQTAGVEEERLRRQQARFRSAARTAAGASGAALEGSPLLAMADNAAEMELDALAIRYSSSIEEARHRSQASLDRLQGKFARRSSYWQAGSSLLSGASSMARLYAGGAS